MRRPRPLLPLLLALALTGAACESTSNYEPPSPGAMPESDWQEKILFSTPVKNHLIVQDVREGRQNGLLRVQVDLRNVNQSETSFRTLIEWYDAGGFKLDSPNDGWMSHILQANQHSSIGASAVSPNAVTWRMNVDAWAR